MVRKSLVAVLLGCLLVPAGAPAADAPAWVSGTALATHVSYLGQWG